jgi:hypothetical protein
MVAVFAKDDAMRRYAEHGNNIVRCSEFDRGGHFASNIDCRSRFDPALRQAWIIGLARHAL